MTVEEMLENMKVAVSLASKYQKLELKFKEATNMSPVEVLQVIREHGLPNDNPLIIEHNHKVKVPKFVAEWLEHCGKRGYSLYGAMTSRNEMDGQTRMWIIDTKNQLTLAKAYEYGYEVEEEPKYITNLVTTAGHKWLLARTEAGNIVLEKVSLTTFKEKYNTGRYFLTKDEIRTIDQGNKLLDNFSVKVEKEVVE